VWITSNDSNSDIIFYDLLGKKVEVELVSFVSDNEKQYSFEKLPKGIYICKVGADVCRIVYH
jgi:hypothetical protein